MYRKLTPDEVEQIERRLLIEMAGRYGRHQDAARERREREVAAAVAEAKKNARRSA